MTPETLPRHELAGLQVAVVDATDPGLVGLAGRVLDETTNTLLVETADGTKQIPKAIATFRFEVDDEAVVVDGERLVARPARRTETTGGSVWR